MNGKLYLGEFKVEAVKQALSVDILFLPFQHVLVLQPTVFTP